MNIKSKFCVKCGKHTKIFIDNFCPSCYFALNPISVPRTILIEVCKKCNSIRWQGIWTAEQRESLSGHANEVGSASDLQLDYYFLNSLTDKIKLPENIELEEVKILSLGKNANVEIIVSVEEQKFRKNYTINLITKAIVCPECGRKAGGVYRAVVQLRAGQSAINDILSRLVKYREKIIKTKVHRQGIDVFFLNKEAANSFASESRAQYNLKMLKTSELYSWDKLKNRPKQRLIILLRQR